MRNPSAHYTTCQGYITDWYRRSHEAARELRELVGWPEACRVVFRVIEEGDTWQEIAEKLYREISKRQECSCSPDPRREDMACWACQASIDKTKIPF